MLIYNIPKFIFDFFYWKIIHIDNKKVNGSLRKIFFCGIIYEKYLRSIDVIILLEICEYSTLKINKARNNLLEFLDSQDEKDNFSHKFAKSSNCITYLINRKFGENIYTSWIFIYCMLDNHYSSFDISDFSKF